jgi:hypothetical protein
MSSGARINASRPNGKPSRGRVTPEGKAISSQNRVNHGLFINSALLPGEDKKEHRKVFAREILEHQPESPVENQIVEKPAVCLSQTNQPDILSRDIAYRTRVAYKESHGDRRCLKLLHRDEFSCLRQRHFLKRERIAPRAGSQERVNFTTNLDFPNNTYVFAK